MLYRLASSKKANISLMKHLQRLFSDNVRSEKPAWKNS